MARIPCASLMGCQADTNEEDKKHVVIWVLIMAVLEHHSVANTIPGLTLVYASAIYTT